MAIAKTFMIGILLGAVVASADICNGTTKPDGGYAHIKDIPYVSQDETDPYKLERCKLDLYYPEDTEGFATLVWFHGGGLEGGSKSLMGEFRKQGFAVADINYRLYPKAKCPAYINDAAEAVAYIFKHIAEYGGDPSRIYVGGHSAGGYLTLMLVLCPEYMAAYGADADDIRKAYPVSGQTFTHFTIKKERGMSMDLPYIDEYAPINNVRKEGAPLMLITGDRDLEMLCRFEENDCLMSILEHFGHPAELYELDGFNHSNVIGPAALLIREDIKTDMARTAGKDSE